jgi:hypothetical protein
MKLDPAEMELLRMNVNRCEARREDYVFIHYFGKNCGKSAAAGQGGYSCNRNAYRIKAIERN